MPSVNTMFQMGGGSSAPHSNYEQTPSVSTGPSVNIGGGVGGIDGTPLRVATIMILAALGLAALRWAGYRFNVTSG